ncbi:MAG: EAL domain-containing protein [Phascolarctobacterium sp.]
MNGIALGTIVIDSDYNVVDFNEPVQKLIPTMVKNKKCYKALLGKDEPCSFCPVIRKQDCVVALPDSNTESVLEIPLPDGRKQHVLSFLINDQRHQPALNCLKYNLIGYCLHNPEAGPTVLENEHDLDKATGLYNMQAFLHYARKLLDDNPYDTFNLIISDIKNFQQITATYGDEKAQALLYGVAQLTKECYADGIVARYGVDQVVSIYKTPTLEQQVQISKRFNDFLQNAEIPNVIIKFGIYEEVDRDISITHMCSKALLALNTIIHDFRRIFAKYDDNTSQNQLKAQNYESRFNDAIENEEFVVWYQPKYNPYTEKIVGAEALVRWQTPQGIVSPGEFLPVFEADGLIERLDRYVFRHVCAQQKKWQDEGRTMIPISVNVSRCSLFVHDIVDKYKSIIDEYGIDHKYVPIEITESVALENFKIKPIADAFANAGFLLHMDDFGSGRSSLNGLNVLHFEAVKLDKSLIDFIGHKNGELVLSYTMALGKELGVQLVAEGVETASQLLFLKHKGCDIIQGFYFSKPLPVDEFEAKLANNEQTDLKQDIKMVLADFAASPHSDALYSHMPGGFFSYEAFGDEKILASNSYLWEMFGFDNEADFMEHVHGSFKGIVSPEELAEVEESIAQQIKDHHREMDFVRYHIIRKDGSRLPVVDYGHLAHQDGRDVFYVFLYEEQD